MGPSRVLLRVRSDDDVEAWSRVSSFGPARMQIPKDQHEEITYAFGERCGSLGSYVLLKRSGFNGPVELTACWLLTPPRTE